MMRKSLSQALFVFFILTLSFLTLPQKTYAVDKVCGPVSSCPSGKNCDIVADSFCGSVSGYDLSAQCCVAEYAPAGGFFGIGNTYIYRAIPASQPGTPPQDSTVTDPGYGLNKICCPAGYYDTSTPLGGGGICSALDIQGRNMEVACCQRTEGPYGTHEVKWAAKQECSQVLANYKPDLCKDVPDSSPDKAKCTACRDSKGVYTAIGCIKTSGSGVVAGLARFLLGIMGGVILIIILAASFKLTTSRGDPKSTESARSMITAAISGALFVVFSMLLLQTLGVQILQIPGF